jgi:hypothetical protein
MRPRLQRPVRWLLLLALTAPLAAGVTGIGDRQAGATSGCPAAVALPRVCLTPAVPRRPARPPERPASR